MKRILFDHLTTVPRLAARILHVLDWNGKLSKRELERKMNANKYPLWEEAWQMLLAKKCIRLQYSARRRQVVHLVETPVALQVKTIVTRPKRSRPPTEWFQQRLPEFLERDGYGADDEESDEY